MLLLEAYREGAEEKDDVPTPLNLAKRSPLPRARPPHTACAAAWEFRHRMCMIATAFT